MRRQAPHLHEALCRVIEVLAEPVKLARFVSGLGKECGHTLVVVDIEPGHGAIQRPGPLLGTGTDGHYL